MRASLNKSSLETAVRAYTMDLGERPPVIMLDDLGIGTLQRLGQTCKRNQVTGGPNFLTSRAEPYAPLSAGQPTYRAALADTVSA